MNHTIINENALLKVNLSFLSDNYNYLKNSLKILELDVFLNLMHMAWG